MLNSRVTPPSSTRLTTPRVVDNSSPPFGKPAVTTFVGGEYRCGNTEERLKHANLGTRGSGKPSDGAFNHKTGEGYVKEKEGHYSDAIINRKAAVFLLVFESLGGMSDYTAKLLRRWARDAKALGCDNTDYTKSSSAKGFVSYYGQLLSWAAIKGTAMAINTGVAKACRDRIRRAAV